MDNQALQRIKDIITNAQHIAITVGVRPSVDDMAAALSLYLALQGINKQVSVLSAAQPLVEHSDLVGIDHVRMSLEASSPVAAGGDLVVSFPYREGEIEKVSYTIDNGFLNIVVKAAEQGLTFSERDVQFSHGGGGNAGGQPDLLFVVGTPDLQEINGLITQETLNQVTIINIDNKEHNQGFGNLVLVSPRFSSVSEQVADLLLSLGIDFDQDTSQNMMIGISSATNNFQDPKTSYVAFEIASILMKKGAHRLEERVQPQGKPTFQSPAPQPQRQTPPAPRPQSQQPTQNPAMGGFTQPFNQSPMNQSGFGQTTPPQPQPQAQSWANQFTQPQPAPAQPARPQPQQPTGFGDDQNRDQQPRNSQAPQQEQKDETNPPADWLTPKVYKGSTSLS